jgi:hypothetical protein
MHSGQVDSRRRAADHRSPPQADLRLGRWLRPERNEYLVDELPELLATLANRPADLRSETSMRCSSRNPLVNRPRGACCLRGADWSAISHESIIPHHLPSFGAGHP